MVSTAVRLQVLKATRAWMDDPDRVVHFSGHYFEDDIEGRSVGGGACMATDPHYDPTRACVAGAYFISFVKATGSTVEDAVRHWERELGSDGGRGATSAFTRLLGLGRMDLIHARLDERIAELEAGALTVDPPEPCDWTLSCLALDQARLLTDRARFLAGVA